MQFSLVAILLSWVFSFVIVIRVLSPASNLLSPCLLDSDHLQSSDSLENYPEQDDSPSTAQQQKENVPVYTEPGEPVLQPENYDPTSPLPHVAQMLCSSFPAPRVAVCFHSQARTFPHTLVHQSQRENFLDALGLPPEKLSVFLHVARKDQRGDNRMSFNHRVDPWTEAQIRQAAEVLAIPSENQKILEGPSVPLPEKCDYESTLPNPKGEHEGSLVYVASLAGQLSHRKGCLDLIEQDEEVRKKKFDSVILIRADLMVFAGFRPYCTYDLTKAYRKWDWFFWMPREMLEATVKKPWADFYSCANKLNGDQWVEHWMDPYIMAPVEHNKHFPVVMVRGEKKDSIPNSVCFHMKLSGGAEVNLGWENCGKMTFMNSWNEPVPVGAKPSFQSELSGKSQSSSSKQKPAVVPES